MTANPLLDELCSRDTVAEILDLLDPIDTLIALMRAQGLGDAQIGAELGISKQSVWERMAAARQRLLDALPELRVVLDGRRHSGLDPAGHPAPPLTVTALARRLDVSRLTVLDWIRAGHLPGAYRQGNRWLIPRSALATFQPPASWRRTDLAGRPDA
jgi:excisionase family DNA binding protein